MKILHTSDWHIGQKLYTNERYEEHEAFLNWLLQTIVQEDVEVLLVSGDVFDVTTPSNRALGIYYRFLAECSRVCKHIIVTGGNHDSISTLNSAQLPLKALNISVVGGATENIEDELIAIEEDGKLLFTIAAVPFLRDKDLKSSVVGESHEERITALKTGIVDHYNQLAEIAKDKKVPSIAMGHLFATGSKTSDSERDIHIGNLGEVSSNQFPTYFDYVALGHIHKPQKLGGNNQIRYSGSPIPLSFSERKDEKEIVLLNFDGKQIEYERSIKTPIMRTLIRVKGDLNTVIKELDELESDIDYTTWVEVEITEPTYSSSIVSDFEEYKSQYKKAKVLKYKISYKSKIEGADELFDEGTGVEDLSPREVFEKKIADEDEADIMLSAFDELMDKINEVE